MDEDVDQQDIEDLVNLKGRWRCSEVGSVCIGVCMRVCVCVCAFNAEFLKNFEQQIDAIEVTDKNERQFPGRCV